MFLEKIYKKKVSIPVEYYNADYYNADIVYDTISTINLFKDILYAYEVQYSILPSTPSMFNYFSISFHEKYKHLVNKAHMDVFDYPLSMDWVNDGYKIYDRNIKINKIKQKIMKKYE